LDAPVGNGESSIGELFGRLADDARGFARAEIGLYRTIAKRRAGKAAGGVAALVVAFLLVNAALIALLVSFVIGLALHIGPVLAGLAVFVVVAIVAGLLARWGAGKMQALSGDAEEQAALAAGERLA
jgi:ACR3 family arsenite efflux pump ArsB